MTHNIVRRFNYPPSAVTLMDQMEAAKKKPAAKAAEPKPKAAAKKKPAAKKAAAKKRGAR